jgi:hypothetical protein
MLIDRLSFFAGCDSGGFSLRQWWLVMHAYVVICESKRSLEGRAADAKKKRRKKPMQRALKSHDDQLLAIFLHGSRPFGCPLYFNR